MISCPRDVFRDALAYSVVAKAGAKKVHRPAPKMSGMARDGGYSQAEILEYATPGGETVARMVRACDRVECWLRADLCTDTLVARADAEAEKDRIIKEVSDYHRASQQHARGQRADQYVLSSSLLHAAARRNATLGRLYDMNSRGDRVRGNLAAALQRAAKAEGAK